MNRCRIHPDKKAHAKGLCKACYDWFRRHPESLKRPPLNPKSISIKDLVRLAHANAKRKGWWDTTEDPNIPEKLALIHSEVSEALEEYRMPQVKAAGNDYLSMVMVDGSKPIGFASELADVLIRIGDLCGYLGIDLEGAVRMKMAYNRTRPYRHGGKRA